MNTIFGPWRLGSSRLARMLPILAFQQSPSLEAAYLAHAAPTRARVAARFALFRLVLLVFTAARCAGRAQSGAAASCRRPPHGADSASTELGTPPQHAGTVHRQPHVKLKPCLPGGLQCCLAGRCWRWGDAAVKRCCCWARRPTSCRSGLLPSTPARDMRGKT